MPGTFDEFSVVARSRLPLDTTVSVRLVDADGEAAYLLENRELKLSDAPTSIRLQSGLLEKYPDGRYTRSEVRWPPAT